jgi:hypothetical protein
MAVDFAARIRLQSLRPNPTEMQGLRTDKRRGGESSANPRRRFGAWELPMLRATRHFDAAVRFAGSISTYFHAKPNCEGQ